MIRSVHNRRVADVVRLHRRRHREASGIMLLEGPRLLAEAAAAGVVLRQVFRVAEDDEAAFLGSEAGAEVVTVSDQVLRRISTTEMPQSPVTVAEAPPMEIPATGDLLVLWGLADPGNVGTLIRIAAAFGMGVVVGPETADPWSPKVLRSAAGGHFHTTIGRCDGSGALRALQRALVATVVAGGTSPADLSLRGDIALLVGEEATGLPDEVVASADHRVTIPMPGRTESLNVAVAGGIVAYEISKRRSGSRPPAD